MSMMRKFQNENADISVRNCFILRYVIEYIRVSIVNNGHENVRFDRS
jgi:F420-dependent methylenetetrahydromethanopterin dehydrogenase